MALRAVVLILALGAASRAALVPFSYPQYPFGCAPNAASLTSPSVSLAAGNTAYVCLTINGRITSIFNVVVDQYTAITVGGSAFRKCPPWLREWFPQRARGALLTPPSPPPHTSPLLCARAPRQLCQPCGQRAAAGRRGVGAAGCAQRHSAHHLLHHL
jgi:hypothetical protein